MPRFVDTDYRNTPSALASLEPLPEVVERNTDSAWQMFRLLQSQPVHTFAATQPQPQPMLDVVTKSPAKTQVSVQEVMVEARARNRAAPVESEWQALFQLLKAATGKEPPAPLSLEESKGVSALVKRVRLRDQVEWAEQHGQLRLLFAFLKSLPEDHWDHIGRR